MDAIFKETEAPDAPVKPQLPTAYSTGEGFHFSSFYLKNR